MGLMVLPLQAYEVKLAPHPAPFSVLKFEGDARTIHGNVTQFDQLDISAY